MKVRDLQGGAPWLLLSTRPCRMESEEETLALYSGGPSRKRGKPLLSNRPCRVESKGETLALYSAGPSRKRGGNPCSLFGRGEWRARKRPLLSSAGPSRRRGGNPCSLHSAVPSGRRRRVLSFFRRGRKKCQSGGSVFITPTRSHAPHKEIVRDMTSDGSQERYNVMNIETQHG